MRTFVLTAALAASTPALAGGIGILGHGGIHTEKVFFYGNTDPATGALIPNEADYPQYTMTQVIPQFGGGFEFILGDRDDRIQGVFRGYYSLDLAQKDPADVTSEIAAAQVVSAHRDKLRHVGMASMGLNWGIVGDTDGFQFGISAHIGSGALTTDHTEFFQAMVGPTVSYRLSAPVVAFADLQYVARFRKGLSNGTQGVVGLRYMFD